MAKVRKQVKPTIRMSVVPGQSPELVARGAAQICIHLFVPDSRGPFTEPNVLQMDKVAQDEGRPCIITGPKQGRLACDTKRTRKVAPVDRNGVIIVTMRSDDPRAVTCIKCKASPDYARMTEFITSNQG